MIKQLLALTIPLLAINATLPQSPAPAPDAATLSKSWKASLDAETDKNYNEALHQVTDYYREGGDMFLSLLRSGWLYYLDKNYGKAQEQYSLASRMQPMAINPLLGLLNIAQARNDVSGIRLAAGSLLHVDPINYRAQMALAYVDFHEKHYQQALSGYQRVLYVYPDDLEATSGAAWSSYYLGLKDEAAAGFRKLLSVDADYTYAAKGLELVSQK